MKKKLLSIIMSICAVLSLTFFHINKPSSTIAEAYTISESTYTISNSGSSLSITKGATNSEFKTNIDSLETAFEEILADQPLDAESAIEIKFDNVSVEEEQQISLTRNFVFSGTLNTKNSSTLFISNQNNQAESSIVFEDITFTNENNTLSNFSFLSISGTSTNITLFNANFNLNSTSEETSHAIKLNSSNHSITLKGTVAHQTTMLYNHIQSTELIVDDDETFEDNFFEDNEGNALPISNILQIEIPYNLNETLCESLSTKNNQRIKLVPESPFFTLKSYNINNSLMCFTEVNLTFDCNSGTNKNAENTPSSITFASPQTSYTFPSESNMSKENYDFDGWFGQIQYNSTTYYFDQILLQTFIDEGYDFEKIPTIFKTNLNNFSISNSFSKYNYSSKDTANATAEFEAVKLMAELEQAPVFIAKWQIHSKTVYFNSQGGSEIAPQTYEIGAMIQEPTTTPTKAEYIFIGWFDDLLNTEPFDFQNSVMPTENITLYAKWQIKTYTISFITDNGESIESITYDYGETISALPEIEKEGFNFSGWFEYDTTNHEIADTVFNLTTMPNYNITLHAKWSIKKIIISFNTNGGTEIESQEIDYNTSFTKPNQPTKEGFVFAGWFEDDSYDEASKLIFDQNNQSSKLYTTNIIVFAKWFANTYHFEIHDNISTTYERHTLQYDKPITLPSSLSRKNFIFGGWFTDETYQTKFTYTKMPAFDISAHAYWIPKQTPTIDESVQTYDSGVYYPEFLRKTKLDGFIVRYYVDNKWEEHPPTQVGSYDIKITREEDSTYASYEKILYKALVIEPVEKNFTWLIVCLFIIFLFEILVTIVARILRKMKQNMMVYAIAIPIGNAIIPKNQVTLLFISGALALFGLILMIYHLVKLNKTIPLQLLKEKEQFEESKEHFEYNEKVIEEEVHTYSAKDIERLLENDSIGQAIKDKHNLNNIEKLEEKEKVPIAPIIYNDDDTISSEPDETSNIDNQNVLNSEDEYNELKPKVEFYDELYHLNSEDEQTKLYNNDDPFVRKDPDDYSN